MEYGLRYDIESVLFTLLHIWYRIGALYFLLYVDERFFKFWYNASKSSITIIMPADFSTKIIIFLSFIYGTELAIWYRISSFYLRFDTKSVLFTFLHVWNIAWVFYTESVLMEQSSIYGKELSIWYRICSYYFPSCMEQSLRFDTE